MQSYQKDFIELALTHNVLRFGEFKLKSGRLSPYFFNVGQFYTGKALKTLGECYARAIQTSDVDFDMLFGPAYKGIPLVCSTAAALSITQDLPYCFNRKETKDHGEGGNIVGAPLKGRVLILDDVITAGTAIRESFELIQQAKAHVSGIIVALDRQEKGQGEYSAIQEIQATFFVKVKAIISLADIMEYVKNEARFSEFRAPLAAYREKYGI